MMNTVTMTTVEIAELTGKNHKRVLEDARSMLAKLGEPKTGPSSVGTLKSEPSSRGYEETTYLSKQNKPLSMLVFDKHLTFTLITGYDTALRHTVVGRWIELETQANPGFLQETVTETLNVLQERVNAMTPAFNEHVRKGRSVGYGWREACRLAGIEHPDLALSLLIDKGRARKTASGHIEIHPDYSKEGLVKALKPSNLVVSKNGGHLFKVTAKGLQEWLTEKADMINRDVLKSRDKTDQWGKVIM